MESEPAWRVRALLLGTGLSSRKNYVMLIPFHPFLIAMQLPFVEAGQLLLVVGISFTIITLIASTHRFHRMIELGEEDLTSVEDCNDFFFIQVTRYLSKINRISTGFGLIIIQFKADDPSRDEIQEPFLDQLKGILREQSDKACLFGEDCIALILDTEEENTEAILRRIVGQLPELIEKTPAITAFRAGASRFPLNGHTSRDIITAATTALEAAPFGEATPYCIAPAPETEEVASEDEAAEGLRKEDKNSSLDPLTGVLKPSVIASYMRKYLVDIRRKKESASVICLGINRIDQVIALHGEEAADSVIRGDAQIIQTLTRDSDLIGRYHRDDFLILAPCALLEGEKIAIRLREAVQKEIFIFQGKRIKTSVSCGITAHPDHGRTLRDLFRGSYAALEIIREWNTSSCLIYDPKQHDKKAPYESAT